jgi:hypothetical protein
MIVPTLNYIPDPKLGDLIALAYPNGIDFGIFVGYGGGTIQFYRVAPHNYAYYKEKNQKPQKSYMGGGYLGERVIRITEDSLSPRKRQEYYELKNFLSL